MRKEWKSVGDSLLFWSQDYNDDTATKLALVHQMNEMSAKLCTKCKPPQECFYLSVLRIVSVLKPWNSLNRYEVCQVQALYRLAVHDRH